jgi:hypothetical protein
MRTLLLLLLLASLAPVAVAAEFKPWIHSSEYSHQESRTTDYLLGLGALQKIGGRWRHKHSEDLRGELQNTTWQIAEGFTAEEGFDWYRQQIPDSAELLFECEGRSCGSSAQWANRVFSERVLYGHDERQHYAVWRWQEQDVSLTLVMYAVDRANRRHFLRMDLLAQQLSE